MKLLVISDDADLRKKISQFAAELKDVVVDFAISAEEGISRIKHGSQNLFILDAETVKVKPQVFFDCISDEKIKIPGYCISKNYEINHPLFRGFISREITKDELEKIISGSLSKKKVLMVEDDRNFVSVVAGLLSGLYEFDYTYDGASALKVVRSKKIDLVILDINLPDINGFRLCKMLRDEFNYTGKILMLTVRGTQRDIQLGAGAGADEYIQKPVSNENFLRAIEKLLTD